MIVAAFQGVVGENIVLEGNPAWHSHSRRSSRKPAQDTELSSGAQVNATIHTEPPSQLIVDRALDFLVVAPHPDDAELGMGGTIAKMVAEGWQVGILDLTSGEPTPHGSEALRRQETLKATETLGVAWRGNAGLPNRKLEPTLEARELIASYFRMLRNHAGSLPHTGKMLTQTTSPQPN